MNIFGKIRRQLSNRTALSTIGLLLRTKNHEFNIRKHRSHIESLLLKTTDRRCISVNVSNPSDGLGAIYNQALHVLNWANQMGFENCRISCPDNTYNEGTGHDIVLDYWDTNYKENLTQPLSIRLFHLNSLPQLESLSSFDLASNLWNTRFQLKNEVQLAIDQSVPELLQYPFIAVHFRSTDKGIEAHLPTIEEFFKPVDRHITDTDHKLFVATDSDSFLDLFRKRYGNRVVFREDSMRSKSSIPIHHHRTGNGNLRSMDALANMVWLSRAQILVKTPSALSGFAKVLNPELEVEMVGNTRSFNQDWFPDSMFQQR